MIGLLIGGLLRVPPPADAAVPAEEATDERPHGGDSRGDVLPYP